VRCVEQLSRELATLSRISLSPLFPSFLFLPSLTSSFAQHTRLAAGACWRCLVDRHAPGTVCTAAVGWITVDGGAVCERLVCVREGGLALRARIPKHRSSAKKMIKNKYLLTHFVARRKETI
jgi:hypothetical protein